MHNLRGEVPLAGQMGLCVDVRYQHKEGESLWVTLASESLTAFYKNADPLAVAQNC